MDIGTLTGPLLLFGGPYSNLQALEALIEEADARSIPADHVICTGDVVAYCGQPAETVALIRDWGCHVVAGNCEEQLAVGALDCGCGFEEGSACDVLSAEWFAFASARIGREDREWMRKLPERMTFRHHGKRWAVIHGGARDNSKMIWRTDPAAVKANEVSYLRDKLGELDGVICGHAALSFREQVGDVTWLNAGVIGMPPHDGRPETEFVTLDESGATFHRLSYDAQAARDAMAGRPRAYADALLTGIWPSEESLPADMRRMP